MGIIRLMLRGVAVAAMLMIATQAQVGAPAASRSASKVAALVGFRVQHAGDPDADTNAAAFTYETWLIVRDETGAHVVAKLPDIIVPRKTGFWRIGVLPTCQFTPPDKNNPEDHGNIHTEAVEYAVPIDQAPQIAITDRPCDAQTAARMLDPSHDANSDQERKATDPTECGFTTERLEGLLPDLISVARHSAQSEACEPRGFHWDDYRWVRRVDKPADPYSAEGKVALAEIFGPAGERAWRKAIRLSLRELAGEGCLGTETVEQSEITDWYFEHAGGAWRVNGFIQIGNGGCQPAGYSGLQMPRRLTMDPPLPAWLATILRRQSTAETVLDGWISPDGSFLLEERLAAITPGTTVYTVREAAAFALSEEKIGSLALILPAQRIIMVQWASGRFVDQWVSALGTFAKALPAAVVKVTAHSE